MNRWRFDRSPRVRQALESLALAVLIAGIAIAAIELGRWQPRSKRSAASDIARSSRALGPRLRGDQRLVPVAAEPAGSAAVRTEPAPAMLRPSASATTFASAAAPESASELFLAANRARALDDTAQAIALSLRIENIFPNSPEGIKTHLSLGVLYLRRGQAELALQEFKIYRHIGDPELMAEALWGEAEALQRLTREPEERAALSELLQNYPRSAYVGAAERRLAALHPD